jgi:hypothetical protein
LSGVENVAMGQHGALGRAGRAAGEKGHTFVVEAAVDRLERLGRRRWPEIENRLEPGFVFPDNRFFKAGDRVALRDL